MCDRIQEVVHGYTMTNESNPLDSWFSTRRHGYLLSCKCAREPIDDLLSRGEQLGKKLVDNQVHGARRKGEPEEYYYITT